MVTGRPITRPRAGRSIWAVLGFLTLFMGIVVMVSRWYLLPAIEAAQRATPDEKRALQAHALLLMALLLVILACGLLLSFGIGRFFFPRPTTQPPVRTRYVDAWAEAGRRAEADREFEYEGGDDDDEPDAGPPSKWE